MLRAFPFRTFDEIAELGLAVEIYCPNCYRTVGPIDLADGRLRGRFFANARFRCSQTRRIYDASPPRECGCLGHIVVRPPPADFIPPHRSIAWCSITCSRCVPHWEVSQAAKHLPPWDKIWTRPGAQLACPACRTALTTTWYGGDGIPYTDGKRRGVTPLSSQVDYSGGEMPGRKVDGRRSDDPPLFRIKLLCWATRIHALVLMCCFPVVKAEGLRPQLFVGLRARPEFPTQRRSQWPTPVHAA